MDLRFVVVLYFEYLTSYPPKEEQDMKQWSELFDKFAKDDKVIENALMTKGKNIKLVQ